MDLDSLLSAISDRIRLLLFFSYCVAAEEVGFLLDGVRKKLAICGDFAPPCGEGDELSMNSSQPESI